MVVNIIRILPLLLIAVAMVAVVVWLLVSASRQARTSKSRGQFEREIKSLALDHLDVSPALAQAVLDQLRAKRAVYEASSNDVLVDDMIHLAIEHRTEDPDFATILTDTVRQHETR